MSTETIYRDLAHMAQMVVGADLDPDEVPSKRELAVGPPNGIREIPFAQIALHYEDDGTAQARFADHVRQLAEDAVWEDTAILRQLLSRVEELNDCLSRPESPAEEWRIFDAADAVGGILNKMYRRLEREALDDGRVAVMFLVRQLGQEVGDDDIAHLLRESPDYVRGVRSHMEEGPDHDAPLKEPWDPSRASVIAQVVYDLRATATGGAIVRWFDTPSVNLGDQSPLDLIEERGTHDAEAVLRKLGRLSRGQVAA